MPAVTYYVFQPFIREPESGRLVPGTAVQVHSRRNAEQAVQRLSGDIVGAIAFARTGNPEDGEWDDAEILAQNGNVLDEYLLAALPW